MRRKPDTRFAWVWLPVLVWAAVIFALSSIPALSSGLGSWDLLLRKAAHVTEYAILGALLVRAAARELIAVALGIVYAASDEVHQSFVPGRSGRPLDLAIDALGVLVGVFLYAELRGRRLAR